MEERRRSSKNKIGRSTRSGNVDVSEVKKWTVDTSKILTEVTQSKNTFWIYGRGKLELI